MKKKIFKSKVFVNRRNNQLSIAIPKKKIKFVGKVPKELKLEIKEIKW